MYTTLILTHCYDIRIDHRLILKFIDMIRMIVTFNPKNIYPVYYFWMSVIVSVSFFILISPHVSIHITFGDLVFNFFLGSLYFSCITKVNVSGFYNVILILILMLMYSYHLSCSPYIYNELGLSYRRKQSAKWYFQCYGLNFHMSTTINQSMGSNFKSLMVG